MSEKRESAVTGSRIFIGSVVALFGFGLLVTLVVASGTGQTPIDRTAAGDFDAETTKLRWKNLDEVSSAQSAALDQDALDKAMSAVIQESASAKATKTELVVPGSPTFLKQAAAAAPPAPTDAAPTDAAPPAVAPTDAVKPAEKTDKPQAPGSDAKPKKGRKKKTEAEKEEKKKARAAKKKAKEGDSSQ